MNSAAPLSEFTGINAHQKKSLLYIFSFETYTSYKIIYSVLVVGVWPIFGELLCYICSWSQYDIPLIIDQIDLKHGDYPMNSILVSCNLWTRDNTNTIRRWNILRPWIHWILHRKYLAIIMNPGFFATCELRIHSVKS